MKSKERSLNLTSSSLFYRELDVLPLLSRPKEVELAREMDSVRMDMLRVLLSLSSGRVLFLQPLEKLSEGKRVSEDLVDENYWSLEHGVIPEDRLPEFAGLLSGLHGSALVESSARDLRLNWHRLELTGKTVFAVTEEYGRLRAAFEVLLLRAGLSRDEVYSEALGFESPGGCTGPAGFHCWSLAPELASIERQIAHLKGTVCDPMEQLLSANIIWREAEDKLEKIMERIVEANLRLVLSVSKRYPTNSVMEEMDLVQEGCYGLIHAARRYDFQRGYRFSTYAVWWIRRYIGVAVTRDRSQTGFPPGLQEQSSVIRRQISDQAAARNRYPTLEEIAEGLDISAAQVGRIHEAEKGQLSMDYTYDDEGGISFGELVSSNIETPESAAFREELTSRISSALDMLSQRERTIISLRYGLFDGRPQSLESISRIFGVSRERIRQIQSRTLARLKDLGLDLPAGSGEEKG
jgi:RNA polymerase sigma factor (sigma-70 family)